MIDFGFMLTCGIIYRLQFMERAEWSDSVTCEVRYNLHTSGEATTFFIFKIHPESIIFTYHKFHPPFLHNISSIMLCKHCEDFNYDQLISEAGYPHHRALADVAAALDG
jgi:hypothetical protein